MLVAYDPTVTTPELLLKAAREAVRVNQQVGVTAWMDAAANAGEIRLGTPCAVYDGKVQAVAQMGLNAGMPLTYNYQQDVVPTPPTKLGGLLRNGFNRGLYWAVARGMI